MIQKSLWIAICFWVSIWTIGPAVAQETFEARIEINSVYQRSDGIEESREEVLQGEFSDRDIRQFIDRDKDNPDLLRKRIRVSKRSEKGGKEVTTYHWDRSMAERPSQNSEGMQFRFEQDFGEGLKLDNFRSFGFTLPGGADFNFEDLFSRFQFEDLNIPDFGSIRLSEMLGSGAYLGISMEEMQGGQGVVVQDVVPGSPAEKAGLMAGDIILAINDEEVRSSAELSAKVQSLSKGEKAMIRLYRGSQEMTLFAEPEFRGLSNRDRLQNEWRFAQPPGSYDLPGDTLPEKRKWRVFPDKKDDQKIRLGVTVESMVNYEGLKVVEVAPGSIAERNGIQKFDIIERFDGKKVNQPKELQTLVADKVGEEVKLRIRRNGKKKNIKVLLQ